MNTPSFRLLLLCLLVGHWVLAQPPAAFDRTLPSYVTQLYQLALGTDLVVAVGGKNQCTHPLVMAFDKATGQTRWTQGHDYNGYGWNLSAAVHPDGTVLAAGISRYADDVAGGNMALLTYWAADGTPLAARYRDLDDDVPTHNSQVAIAANGDVVWLLDNRLLWLDAVGNTLDSASVSFAGQWLVADAVGNVAVCATDGRVQIFMPNHAAVPSVTVADATITSARMAGGYLWLASGTALYQANPVTAALVATHAVPLPSASGYLLADAPDELVLWGDTHILRLALQPTPTWTSTLTHGIQHRQHHALHADADSYYLLGHDRRGNGIPATYSAGFAFVQRQPLGTPPRIGTDLRIESVETQLESATAFYNPLGYYWSLGIRYEHLITVRNAGLDTLYDSYNLLSDRLDGFNCVDIRIYTTQSGVLAPGESQLVRIERTDRRSSSSPFPASIPVSFSTCFFVTLPDGALDADPLNDYRCTAYSGIIAVTDTDAPESVAPPTLFPNPTDGLLHIQGGTASWTSAQLHDITGQRIGTFPLHPDGTLDLRHLPPGVYVCTLIGGQQRHTLRIVVSR